MIDKEEDAGGERVFEWLVPEGGQAESDAVRVMQFVKALSAHATGNGDADLDLAREELERSGSAQACAALEDLLRLHLASHLGGTSFAWFGQSERSAAEAWRALEALREEGPPLPGVPEPDESSLAVAARLLEALFRWGAEPAQLELWRARLELSCGGAAMGVEAFRARLDKVEPLSSRLHERTLLLAGLVESLFDAGSAREAQILLQDHPALVAGDERLRQLEAWGQVIMGNLEGAQETAAGLEPWSAVLPEALVDLRASWPEALRWLPGREDSSGALRRGTRALPEKPTSRGDLGAAVLAVFAFGPGRSAEPLLVDIATGLRHGVEGWLIERENACAVPSLPEHELVLTALPCISHGESLRGSLDPRSLARALVPVLDHEQEVAGWLHLECEHHLLPSTAQLMRFAAAWRPAVLRRGRFAQMAAMDPETASVVSECRPSVDGWNRVDAEERLAQRVGRDEQPFLAEVFEALVETLGLDSARRRWWGFRIQGSQLESAASGGGRERPEVPEWGGARALERALATGGVVQFSDADEGLCMDKSARSGVVLPILASGECLGLLAVESCRRNDFVSHDFNAYCEAAEHFALALEFAALRAWHHHQHGHDLYFDPTSMGFEEFASEVRRASASKSPVLLSGPTGSGKTIIARWIQRLKSASSEPLEVLDVAVEGAHGGAPERLAAKLAQGGDRGLLIEGLSSMDPESQGVLLAALEGNRGKRPLYVTSNLSAADATEQGLLRSDLAARLDRLQLHIPSLADRREEIVGWIGFLSRRFALEEGCSVPSFTDEALALLWRQDWGTSVRDLESFVFKLVLSHGGGEIDVDGVRDVAKSYKVKLKNKIPSRHPRRWDLVAAVRSTFKGGNNFNKSRAALYLGWDPDTLVSRLNDAAIDAESLACEPLAWRR
jgi:transcriptional regulator with AAA-type ATPase domain